MTFKDWIKDKLELYKDDFEFRLESLIMDITESVSRGIDRKNINRSQLAELLEVSPAYVTKILNGNSNFTLKSLLSLSDALDLDLKIELRERETKPSGQWLPKRSVVGWVSSTGEPTFESEKKEKQITAVSSAQYIPEMDEAA